VISPVDLVDNLVSAMQDVEDLVTAMGGDSDLIYAYHDRYPSQTSLEKARYEMKSPSVMVAWMGLMNEGGIDPWKHKISIVLRAPCESEDDGLIGYNGLLKLIWNGKKDPDDIDEQPIKYKTILTGCYPMELESFLRQTDGAGIDYFEITVSFTEIGDE
jgi:hypothetical protein